MNACQIQTVQVKGWVTLKPLHIFPALWADLIGHHHPFQKKDALPTVTDSTTEPGGQVNARVAILTSDVDVVEPDLCSESACSKI